LRLAVMTRVDGMSKSFVFNALTITVVSRGIGRRVMECQN